MYRLTRDRAVVSGPLSCTRGLGAPPPSLRPDRPFRSQSCPELHSCSSSVLPGALATGQFPTGPSAPSGQRAFSQGRYSQGEPPRAVPAPGSMLGGRLEGLSLSFPTPKRAREGWGWSIGPGP